MFILIICILLNIFIIGFYCYTQIFQGSDFSLPSLFSSKYRKDRYFKMKEGEKWERFVYNPNNKFENIKFTKVEWAIYEIYDKNLKFSIMKFITYK